MTTPTCPHCHTPQEAIAALPFAGGLAIILDCGKHQSVKWLPRSRFIAPSQPFDATPLAILALTVAPPLVAILV